LIVRCFYCGLLLLVCSPCAHTQKISCLFALSRNEQKSNDSLAGLDADSTSPGYGQTVVFSLGDNALLQPQASGKTHKVTLTWKPSSSHVAGYNVYRSIVSGQKYQKINSSLILGLTYADETVVSGVTYYYVTRAVDDQGHESPNSNETSVAIP